MDIKNTNFWENWLFIIDKFKENRDLNKGELLEELGFDSTSDYNWKLRNRIAETSLRRILLHVNRELGWNLSQKDLLHSDISKKQLKVSDISDEYLIQREKEILRIFRNSPPEQQQQILDYLRYLSTKK